jgi:hypothetical protein
MTRSIPVAALLVATLAACAQKPAAPPPVVVAAKPAAKPASGSFVPYCGPVWSVGRQGYVEIPCPANSNYDGGQ